MEFSLSMVYFFLEIRTSFAYSEAELAKCRVAGFWWGRVLATGVQVTPPIPSSPYPRAHHQHYAGTYLLV